MIYLVELFGWLAYLLPFFLLNKKKTPEWMDGCMDGLDELRMGRVGCPAYYLSHF